MVEAKTCKRFFRSGGNEKKEKQKSIAQSLGIKADLNHCNSIHINRLGYILNFLEKKMYVEHQSEMAGAFFIIYGDRFYTN